MFASFLLPYIDRGHGPLFPWVMLLQAASIPPEELVLIADDRYFQLPLPWGAPLNEFGFRFACPSQADWERIPKHAVPSNTFDELEARSVSMLEAFRILLTEDYAPLRVALERIFEELCKRRKPEAVLSWCHAPSLKRAAARFGIPVIHNELGPLRPPIYRGTVYFDFKGVNGFTSAADQMRQFAHEAAARKDFKPLQLQQLRELLIVDPEKRVPKSAPPPFRAGAALQVEDDSNLLAFSRGMNNFELIFAARKGAGGRDLLIRQHPRGHVRYSENLGVHDDSPDAVEFLSRCHEVFTTNSSVAFECLLQEKPVRILGDSPAALFSTEKLASLSPEKRLLCLNWLFIGHLIPARLLFDPEYCRWRLGDPSLQEIFNAHIRAYLDPASTPPLPAWPAPRRMRLPSRFDFIEHFNQAVLAKGEPNQAALWDSLLDGQAARTICLHPPAQLIFRIPSGTGGYFTTAVAIHPDAWDKPGAGGCEFQVRADGQPVATIHLDPTHEASHRCWHDVRIELPEITAPHHEIALETRSLDSTSDFRWALWRAPEFIPAETVSSRTNPMTPQPTMTFLEPPASHPALIDQANAAFEAGDMAGARKFLDTALKEKPDDGELALALGHTKLSLGDLPGALANYTTAAERLPALATAHSCRALALQLLKKTREAESVALCALLLDPADLVALKVLARLCLDARRHSDAQAYCRRILAIAPKDEDALKLQEENALAQPAQPALIAGSQVNPAEPGPSIVDELHGDYTARSRAWQSFGIEHLLHILVVGNYDQPLSLMQKPALAPVGADGLPVPPADLTMGYGSGNLDHYLACGRRSHQVLTQLLQAHNLTLDKGDAMLDWGSAAGRVTRNFVAETARGCEVWGCDVHTPSIQWAQDHLSPPFRFFNSSSLPHLPFPDRTFKFIYGLSVVTHLIAMRDLWLLELRRLLQPDGCLFLSVHDENTWTWFLEHGMPAWVPPSLRQLPNLPANCIEIRGNRWENCYTFFHSDYIRRTWGRFFHIAEIKPRADSYQAIVVLKSK